MDIVNPEIEGYLSRLDGERSPVLLEMEERARNAGFPIVGPQVGRLLAVLARAAGARSVLELGSGFGYSALWFARALPEEGTVLCTDTSERHEQEAREYFRRSGLEHKLRFAVGDALEILEAQRGPFDIILNDIDKQDYPRVVELVLPRLRRGGLFITDNTLWGATVLEEHTSSVSTAGVRRFNEIMAASPQTEAVLLPLRDGLTLAVKK